MAITLTPELSTQFAKISEHHLIKALDQLIIFAMESGASDIHFEPTHTHFGVRFRIDGVLSRVLETEPRFAALILSRLKILAELDIAEKRLPQDGRFLLISQDKRCEGRISTCPTLFGEKAVVRLLPTQNQFIELGDQGMTSGQLAALHRIIHSPHGLVVVTGPTGSGKTMTLYGLLQALNTDESNLISMEDPVEMVLPGVNQVSIQEKGGIDFKRILRSLLRQDPDVLMIGEIRDAETAEIAIKAAQTGHLVLSSLHTASSMQALLRLEQLGIARYLLIEATRLIIAQRLVRKSCAPSVLCHDGFRGRVGIFELFELNAALQDKLSRNEVIKNVDYIDALDLREAGVKKVKEGITVMAEVERVV